MLLETMLGAAANDSGEGISLAAAETATRRTFELTDKNSDKSKPALLVTVEERNGSLLFNIVFTQEHTGTDSLKALYFHIADPSLESSLIFSNATLTVRENGGALKTVEVPTARRFGDNSVTTVGGDTNINGNTGAETGFDIGVAFDPPSKSQDVTSATFILSRRDGALGLSFIERQIGARTQDEKFFADLNNAPVGADISVSGDEDATIPGQLTATDRDGDTLTYQLATDGAPKNGTVTVNLDGTFSYQGQKDFTGTDSFTVLISDGNGGETTSVVKVIVNPINDDPSATPVSVSGEQGKDISGKVTGFDVDLDRLTYTIANGGVPKNGAVTLNLDGTFTYRGNEGFQGTDTFTVLVDDGNGGQTTSLVTVTVNPSAGEGSEQPVAGSYDDLIEAGDGDDFIHGGRGNDEMQGEGGNDTIYGGTDRGEIATDASNGKLKILIGDNLYGNDGRDTYRYAKGDGVDMIWDFRPGDDLIELSGYSLADIKVTWVGKVSNWIDTPWHAKLAVIFSDGGGIILNDYSGLDTNPDAALKLIDRVDPETGKNPVMTFAQLYALAGPKPQEPPFNDSSATILTPTPGRPDPTEADASETASSVEISFTNGDDTFAAGGGDDRLYGNDGYNWLEGHGGHDQLFGGNGKDVLIGGNGKDRLYGNEGENWLDGEAGSDELYGGNVRDIILSGSGNDMVRGNSGDDWIIGGSGSDDLHGAGGADVIFGDEYIDGLIEGGAPTQWSKPYDNPDPEAPSPWVISEGRFLFTKTSMTLADDVQDVTAQGKASIKITGNWRDNVIVGNGGKNTIKAGAGNDELNGGYGNDILTGGTGSDTFLFSSKLGSYKTDRKVNFDQITDFSVKNDTIKLENKIFTKLTKTGKLNKSFFTIGSEAKDSNDYVIFDKETGVLSYDKDGSGGGKAIEFARLKQGLALKHDDLIVM